MSRPRALDLFCGAGGAAMGLHRAGFDVVGIDNRPQPRYPFPFIRGDALNPPARLSDFDLVWASPPCQGYSAATAICGRQHPRLIAEVRAMLRAAGPPYVIENVPRSPLMSPVVLCGSAFGLGVRRHRLFEPSFHIPSPGCFHAGHKFVTLAGGGPNPASFQRPGRGGPHRNPRNKAAASDAIGIDWMTRSEMNEAIPPAYSEWIGRYALIAIGRVAA